jgi:glutamate synthase (ferredoxin)
VLDLQQTMRDRGLTPEDAELAAFEANMQDPARVGGK